MADPRIVSLHGQWQIKQLDGKVRLVGRVPGLVHHDLLDQGLVEDPYYRKNEIDQQWVGDATWEYSRTFRLSAAQVGRAAVVLNCDGLDTVCDVYVNDKKIASPDNMHIRWRWDIKKVVHAGDNTVRIVFHPARKVMDDRQRKYTHRVGSSRCMPWEPLTRSFVRKCACHGGWDWGICLLTQGIYRDIYIECRDGARVLYLTNTQEHEGRTAFVHLRAIVDAASAGRATVSFALGGEAAAAELDLAAGENTIEKTLEVRNPRLWWPNGMGPQELYPCSVRVEMNGEMDAMAQQIGLRNIELVTEKDQAGESFYFRVNGVPVFAKGSNWIPSDSFESRLTDDQIEWELASAAKAHQNMIRVWGGGLYQRDSFYETCDRLGLLIWHDFMFACALYPTNPDFLESVRAEVLHQVRRLMHHASIALWCGNNENEQAMNWHGGPEANRPLIAAEYDQLYIQTIYPVVAEEDPGRRFWPSSPSNGIRQYADPQDPTRGDVHFWGVWHGDKPFTEYLNVRPRFSSEFGFQSFASPETMETVTAPEDRNITSPVFEFHQRSGTGNLRILSHIARHFRIPTGYESMLYVSQALQAESIKTACEHWRRIKPHNMGAIYWQLNDIWPVASWSSLEYDGRWKLLHYACRRFFAPVLVSSVVEGEHVEVWATSDVNAPLPGKLSVRLMDLSGKRLMRDAKQFRLGRLESRRVAAYRLADLCPTEADKGRRVLAIEAECGQYESRNVHFFAPFKALELAKPRIESALSEKRGGKLALTLKADTLAPFTWVRHGNIQGVWSDNGMHLLPGEKVALTFEPRTGTTLAAMKRALKIETLYEAGV